MLEAAAGEGPPLFAQDCLILTRAHTMDATQEHKASGGKDWDTVKPLARYFSKLDRLLLIDDDAYKVHAIKIHWLPKISSTQFRAFCIFCLRNITEIFEKCRNELPQKGMRIITCFE